MRDITVSITVQQASTKGAGAKPLLESANTVWCQIRVRLDKVRLFQIIQIKLKDNCIFWWLLYWSRKTTITAHKLHFLFVQNTTIEWTLFSDGGATSVT